MAELTRRRDAFESKFAHDEALHFKAAARRNKMLGLWAAKHLGKSGAEAEAYAQTVVIADLEEPGDEDVIRKILRDLNAAGVATDEAQVRRLLEQFMLGAIEEVKSGR
jgi:hypothetical protein